MARVGFEYLIFRIGVEYLMARVGFEYLIFRIGVESTST